MNPSGILNNYRNRESALEHVFNSVISAIVNDELKPGDKLPTEPELGQSLGVGRNTVREAIKILEAYGVVTIRRPEGTFVNEAYSSKMLDPMLYGLLLKKDNWRDLVELRGALEIGTLFSACRTVTEEDILSLEALVNQLDREIHKPVPSVDALMELDQEFHSQIVRITGNRMILDVTEYITKFTLPSRRRTVEQVLQDKEIEPFIKKHCDIVGVLREKDYGSIDKVVMSHYEYWMKTE
ncbi:MAG: FadR/GntR family transcriptional regulator [Oscillospiraceae bacterium]